FPGNYVPEEIIFASGAIPICLIDGGSLSASDAGLSVVPNIICPFARGLIGKKILEESPYYNMLDILVAPIVCRHLQKIAEVWEYYTDIEVFKLGVPHQYYGDLELEYYRDGLKRLKKTLQSLTGNEITDKKISEAINLYNKMRSLLKSISLMRREPDSPISTIDFVKLNHASYYADPAFMVEELDKIHKELKEAQQAAKEDTPRLLLLGPNLAYGDYQVLELVESAGAEIVIEDLFEGMRYYWNVIENIGDLFQSLAKGYLRDREHCAFMRNSVKNRFEFALKLISEYDVSGVIWYELLNCETYDSESYYFAQKMGERGIPMLILESDYSMAGIGQVRVRIEAFIEILKGGIA
ncbi:2-hydroxyacyl-CoA dehydratase subunit D, partial [Thermodesulfobacteriota bacterium]